MKREILGRAFATSLKKRLIPGRRNSVLPIVRGLVVARGGVATPARNRDENTSGNIGMSAAVPLMNREMRGQALAT